MKILKKIWFNPLGQTIGIIITENNVGTKKARIGMGLGHDEETDAQRIGEYGVQLHEHQLTEILNDLKSEE